jgi:glycosyltransferase involved in cell wall biosynthesis
VPEPLVSVVVPTHNRPARLARLLASLCTQSLDPGQFEVIVVDDGSKQTVGASLSSDALALRYVRHDSARGPAAARNTGWRLARAPLVAFTDDDCVADPQWLRAALAASAAAPGSFVQGMTLPDPSEGDNEGLCTRTVRVVELGPHYETCNVLYPRAVLESLGGFDERFGPRPTAEDTDLAWRALRAGHGAVFAPDALVHHAVQRLGAGGMLDVANRWGPAVRLFAAHPETRSILYRGVFWNVWHYLLWRSLLALAAPQWLRRMLLTRHLLELRRRARAAGSGARAVPFLLLHDAIESCAIARGAIRYRTLVL